MNIVSLTFIFTMDLSLRACIITVAVRAWGLTVMDTMTFYVALNDRSHTHTHTHP